MFGEAIVNRLAEATAAGQDGIVVFFPDAPEIRIASWVTNPKRRAPKANLARRVIPADPDWQTVQ